MLEQSLLTLEITFMDPLGVYKLQVKNLWSRPLPSNV